jgi:glutamine amidotransferase
MIGIIDYGMGNLKSVSNAFLALGFDAFVATRPEELDRADKVILPGVGAFEGAIAELKKQGWADKIMDTVQSGKHILGICLGMQLMFETSYENGTHSGLGIFPGQVVRIPDGLSPDGRKLKIPQVGWNKLEVRKKSDILPDGGDIYVYFVHSYYVQTSPEYAAATTFYGVDLIAAAERGNVYAVQFHPEKSGENGLKILRNFALLGSGTNA